LIRTGVCATMASARTTGHENFMLLRGNRSDPDARTNKRPFSESCICDPFVTPAVARAGLANQTRFRCECPPPVTVGASATLDAALAP
jgi:hypothetical protein